MNWFSLIFTNKDPEQNVNISVEMLTVLLGDAKASLVLRTRLKCSIVSKDSFYSTGFQGFYAYLAASSRVVSSTKNIQTAK